MANNSGKKGLLDFFKSKRVDDEDEYEDDIFDEDDDDDEDELDDILGSSSAGSFGSRKPKDSSQSRRSSSGYSYSGSSGSSSYSSGSTSGSSSNYGSSSYGSSSYGGSSYGSSSYGSSSYGSSSGYGAGSRSQYQGASQSAKKTTSRSSSSDNGRVVPIDTPKPQRSYRPTSEVYVIKPNEFDDAQTVSDFLKAGKTIVINLEGVELDSAQRIIDFIGGACYGLDGELNAISSNIFIASPNNIEVSGDLREEILNETMLSPHLS